MTVIYADLSHYSYDRHGGLPDFAALKASGILAVCIRATYGDPVVFNPATRQFREMAQAAKAAGLFVGGYHNLVHGDDASIARQVAYFKTELDAVGADWAMLDVEPYAALVSAGLWPRLDDAVRFEAAWTKADPNRRLAVYLAKWFWQRPSTQHGLDGVSIAALQGPLVSSNYPASGETSPVAIYATVGGDAGPGWQPYGGKVPEIWQFTSRAILPGVSSTEDVNAFKGTLEQFKARMRKEAPAPVAFPDFKQYGTTPYANTTDAMYWFWRALDAFEPVVKLGGMFADKRGFHNRGDGNPDYGQGDSRTDYSIRDAVNRTGPYWKTKAAAIDLTFPDNASIAKYSKRLYNSARDDADPRLGLVMYDFYGQIDTDNVVEGWDELHERPATSDSSHLWHIHISLLRSKVGDFWAMFALLTVLMGWSVAQWKAAVQAGGGTPVPAPPQPAPLPTYKLGSRTLKNTTPDMRGTDVRDLQKLLGVTADGIYGSGTEASVIKLQRARWLAVDGEVGPDTLASIRTGLGRRVLKNTSPDMKGSDIKELQRRLKISQDGIFGGGTAKAVVAFQAKYGLSRDGEVGPLTGRKLWSAT